MKMRITTLLVLLIASAHGAEISGDGNTYVPATTAIQGEDVVVTRDEIKAPKAVRFGWAEVPNGNLFNKNGLPATPFHTGSK